MLLVAGLVMLICPVPVVAEELAAPSFAVRIVINKDNLDHEKLVAVLGDELVRQSVGNVQLTTEFVETFDSNRPADTGQNLLVTVGTMSTLEVIRTKPRTGVLSVLIPRVSYESIRDSYVADNPQSAGMLSAIYLDQPFARRFALARQLLPDAEAIGVVLGPSTMTYRKALNAAAAKYRFRLNVETIDSETQLLPALGRVLRASQALLAILDPLVFNRSNAQTVLLTSYRYRIPIIGISPGYTNAGALAAVYSTPEQIGRQLALVLREMAADQQHRLPAPQYPEFFSISINQQIARSLGIRDIGERELWQRLNSEKPAVP